jgi:hypothetical protein
MSTWEIPHGYTNHSFHRAEICPEIGFFISFFWLLKHVFLLLVSFISLCVLSVYPSLLAILKVLGKFIGKSILGSTLHGCE